MLIGNKEFSFGKETYIMGILNVTPDSFFDGGKYIDLDAALKRTEKMIKEGASIIDVGGESTRPGYTMISDEEEISRVVPVISAIKKEFPEIPISIDTYKSNVLEKALEAGADMLNDIWGLKYDKNISKVAADNNIPCCIGHNSDHIYKRGFMPSVVNDLTESIVIALNAGIKPEKLIIDPGIGFSKTYEQNLELVYSIDFLKDSFNVPILVGLSRKSFIGTALNDAPKEDRLIGTIAAVSVAISKGCDIIRVHDVKETRDACLVCDAITRTLFDLY